MNTCIEGESGVWEMVIGLEVHAQIRSAAKLFSNAPTVFGAAANSQVSYVDAAMPGMLPVLNRFCVEQGVRAGLGLGGRINLFSVFERKNYFYPDLPQGYQISQYQYPLVSGGKLMIRPESGKPVEIRIERLHLEQDAGKSMHENSGSLSLVDLNRCGVALMEIVSQPDMRSAADAQAYVRELRLLLRYLGVCDGNMEEGSLRADVNISMRHPGENFGTRCEIKNLNSIRFIGQAIEHEARRQVALLEAGEKVEQETRLFDIHAGVTRSMRSKEEAHDYRYFPDPDLPPLRLSQEWVNAIAANLPELPENKRQRLIREYGLDAYDAEVLVAKPREADFFEQVAKGRDAKPVVNWVTGDLFAALNKSRMSIEDAKIAPLSLGTLLDLLAAGDISGRIAKEVFAIMFETGANPLEIIEKKGWRQISDPSVLESHVNRILQANPDKVEQAKKKPKMIGWFIAQVMKATQNKANPKSVNELLKKKLEL